MELVSVLLPIPPRALGDECRYRTYKLVVATVIHYILPLLIRGSSSVVDIEKK